MTQRFYEIKQSEKNNTLIALLKHYKPESTIVFCNTKANCKEIASRLNQENFLFISNAQ